MYLYMYGQPKTRRTTKYCNLVVCGTTTYFSLIRTLGEAHPPKKVNLTKIEEKEGKKKDKIKKIDQNYHNVIYKWVKIDEFFRG